MGCPLWHGACTQQLACVQSSQVICRYLRWVRADLVGGGPEQRVGGLRGEAAQHMANGVSGQHGADAQARCQQACQRALARSARACQQDRYGPPLLPDAVGHSGVVRILGALDLLKPSYAGVLKSLDSCQDPGSQQACQRALAHAARVLLGPI